MKLENKDRAIEILKKVKSIEMFLEGWRTSEEKEISNEIIDFFDPTKIGSINSNNNYVLVSFLIIEG